MQLINAVEKNRRRVKKLDVNNFNKNNKLSKFF